MLEHALSKVGFSVGTYMYMLPSNLNLSIGKTNGYNKKNLVSNTEMKTGSNRDIKDVPKTVIPAARHDPVETTKLHNLKMFTEKHNDEKLAITLLLVGKSLIAYHF